MSRSTLGLTVHHHLLEFTQTHVHRVRIAIQPSHPRSSPPPPAPIPPSIRVFSNESALRIRWPKFWSFSFSISSSIEYSGLISFRMDWLDLLALNMPANLENSAVVTGLEKVRFHSSSKERQCQRKTMPMNVQTTTQTALISHVSKVYAQNSPRKEGFNSM